MDWQKHFADVTKRKLAVEDTMGGESNHPSGGSIAKVPGIEKLTKSQLTALVTAAKSLGMNPDWLATVMSFETGGTFSPTVLNKAGSGAFGLIQFMPSTAKNLLGTATNDEAVKRGLSMNFETQLKQMVVPYFKGGTYHSLDDVYLKVFYPAAMNKPADYIVGSAPSKVYSQNAGFDHTGKGYITRSDITSRINSVLNASTERILVTASGIAQIILGVSIASLVAMGWYEYKNPGTRASLPNVLRAFRKG